jgi:hypothetical protein
MVGVCMRFGSAGLARRGGAEAPRLDASAAGGASAETVGEAPAVRDERVDDAERAGDARGHGPIGIGLDGCDRGGGVGQRGIKA